MLASFVFNETSPNAPGSAASTRAVAGAASYLVPGVAGPLDDYEAISVIAELVGATGGTLDVYIQTSPDQGVTWYDTAHLPQLLAGAGASTRSAPLSLYGTVPTPTVVGKGTTGALAASTIVPGAFSDRCRLLMIAGVGTTLGAPVRVILTAQRARKPGGRR